LKTLPLKAQAGARCRHNQQEVSIVKDEILFLKINENLIDYSEEA